MSFQTFKNLVRGPASIIFTPTFPTGMDNVYVGYGKDVAVLSQEKNVAELLAPNQATGVESVVKLEEKFYLTYTAMEMDLDRLKMFWGTSDTVSETGAPPTDGTGSVSFGGNEQPVEGKLYIYGMAPNGKSRKITMHKCALVGSPQDYPFDRANRTAMVLKFVSLIDDTKEPGLQQIKIEDDYDTAYTIDYGLSTS